MKRILLAALVLSLNSFRRRLRAGDLREQGRQQGGQAARGRCQDQFPQEVQARHLSGQGGGQQRQGPRRRRQEKLHAEVPSGKHRRAAGKGAPAPSRVEGKHLLPVALHVDDGPAAPDRFIPGLVEASDRRVAVIGPFAHGVGVMARGP